MTSIGMQGYEKFFQRLARAEVARATTWTTGPLRQTISKGKRIRIYCGCHAQWAAKPGARTLNYRCQGCGFFPWTFSQLSPEERGFATSGRGDS